MIVKYTNSKLYYYFSEILIFILYFFNYFFIFSLGQNLELAGMFLGLISYVFFIIEHKTDLVFNKINNVILIREKMLFFDMYTIKKHFSLSNFQGAQVFETAKRNSKTGRYEKFYELKLLQKDGSFCLPFGFSTRNKQEWQVMAENINNFQETQEAELILSRAPFFLRLCIGSLFGFFYFLMGLVAIFPNYIKPILFNLLNNWLLINGYN